MALDAILPLGIGIVRFAPAVDAGKPEAIGGSCPIHGIDELLDGNNTGR